MRRVALRDIRAHLGRTALAILAVALGVAFVAGTFSFRTLLSSTFDAVIATSAAGDAYVRGAEKTSGTDVVAGSATTVHAPVPATLADVLAATPGVAHARPEPMGVLTLFGADGTVVTTGGAPTIATPFPADDLRYPFLSGRAPSGADEIALEERTAERSGLTTGSTTTVVLDGAIREVTVSGILSFDGPLAGALIVGLDPAVALATLAPDGLVPHIAVEAVPGTSQTELRDAVAAALAASDAPGAAATETVTGDTVRDESRVQLDDQIGFIQVFLLGFAGVSLAVATFLIANAFSMQVRQRRRELALLRAIGASPGQVLASVLVQAFVIGAVGSLVGVALGTGLAAGIGAIVSATGTDMSGSVIPTWSTIALSVAVGITVSVLGALVPARRAALVAPVEAMREDTPSERGLLVRGVLGGLLVALGAACVAAASLVQEERWADLLGSADGGTSTGSAVLALGAIALVVGVLVLAPVLARPVVSLLAWPSVVLARPLGALARGNVVRQPRRTAATAGALTIGMVLVSASAVLASSAATSMRSVVESDLLADLMVSGQPGVPSGAIDALAPLPEVASIDPVSAGLTSVAGLDGPQWVFDMPAELPERSIALHVVDGSLDSLARGEVLVLEPTAKANDWRVGDTLTLGSAAAPVAGADGAAAVTIGAIVTSRAFGGALFMPQDLFADVTVPATRGVAVAFLRAAPGTSVDQLRDAVTPAVTPYGAISVQDADDLADQLTEQVNQLLAIVYAMLALSIVIAVLGIVNTLALSVVERRREISLLRAVGLGRLQLASVIGIESVLTAVFGTALGVAVGIGVSSALPTVMKDMGLTDLVIPWGQIGVLVGLAALVGVAAAVWPAIRAARVPVLEGLAAE